ncbi:unnamed protein product [Microthlaspi erraticum]|uniref:Uncharacterized protein n=1 Tax=Microthlaspi erraticum TaxID=1685480 RepID=A0A6D2JDD5_9BRAS|nr:unnamed protein product [Microthlaspi erraticum]
MCVLCKHLLHAQEKNKEREISIEGKPERREREGKKEEERELSCEIEGKKERRERDSASSVETRWSRRHPQSLSLDIGIVTTIGSYYHRRHVHQRRKPRQIIITCSVSKPGMCLDQQDVLLGQQDVLVGPIITMMSSLSHFLFVNLVSKSSSSHFDFKSQ